jgi:predicted dehydrogenase
MTFRILLAGLGNRGKQWAGIVGDAPGIELAAAVDPSSDARAIFAERFPGVPIHEDLGRALSDVACDAVLLVTPPDGHLAQAREVFAAGKPLLCEKPVATGLDEALRIVEMSEQARLPLSIGLNFRYLPVSMALRDLVATKTYGEPGFGNFVYQRNRDGMRPGLNKYPLTMRHPMMLEQSIHHLDLIRFCYGREATHVACRTWNPGWSMYAHDANVSCLITLDGGMEVIYLGTWTGGWNELRFEWRTDCAGGAIVQRELFSDLAAARTGDTALTTIDLPEARAFIDDTAALLDAFVAAVRGGGAPPCGGRDHLRSLALCFAAIESAETGQRVDIRAFEARHGLVP